jgi:rRNA maturation protein Nop10
MTKLKKCESCKIYTLKEKCPECGQKTKDAHYKFVKIKSVQNKKQN